MEIKPWDEYSFSEKKTILNFWFGNTNQNRKMITREDREYFKLLLERDIDLIMDFVINLTIFGHNSEAMIVLMRNGTLENSLATFPRMKEDEDFLFIKRQVITMLVGLCNITMKTTDGQEIMENAMKLAEESRKQIVKHFF